MSWIVHLHRRCVDFNRALAGSELNSSHEAIHYRDHHLRSSAFNVENTNMDNFLDSVTRKGRKVKERLRGKKDKRDKTGANTAEESIDSSSSLLRPVPHIAAGGHDEEGGRTSTDTRQVHPRGRSPRLESVPVGGREDDREGREASADEKEVDQGHSCPEQNLEIVVGGGPGLASVRPLSPSPPTPILLDWKSDST